MNFGIDVGNGFTKYAGGKFPSKIKLGKCDEPTGEIHGVTFEGTDYTVGTKGGTPVIEKDKYFDNDYKILLLTAICLANKNTLDNDLRVNVVVGVPANQYKKDRRDKIKKSIQNNGKAYSITVDDRAYNITIEKAEVFMEGCVPIYTNDNGSILVIDVGSGTINVVQWEDKQRVFDFTTEDSMYKLYLDMEDFLNRKYELGVNSNTVEKFLGKEYIMKDGEKHPTPELIEMLANTVKSCVQLIQKQPSFEARTSDKVLLIGGGARLTEPYFKKFFKNIQAVDDSQFINQKVYDIVSKVVFNEK